MTGITLTASMHSNLSSLKNISAQMSRTQERLSTGLKVNSAIDNASSYYRARSLTNRAADLISLLNSMDQGIQTIAAANEGIESAGAYLEQLATTAEQALSTGAMKAHEAKIEYNTDVAALIAQGYTAVDSTTTAAELQDLLNTDGAKVVLTEDVSLSGNMTFKGKNIVFNGGGHTLTVKNGYILNEGTGATYENMRLDVNLTSAYYVRGFYSGAANTAVRNVEVSLAGNLTGVGHGIELRGSGSSVEHAKVSVAGNAEQLVGVYLVGKISADDVEVSLSGGSHTLMAGISSTSAQATINEIGLTTSGGGRIYGVIGAVSGVAGHSAGGIVDKNSSLYTGQANTDAILAELGEAGLAASAANQFYVGDKDGAFGQGSWYLPSIAELMNMYGYDAGKLTGGLWSTSGATGDNKKAVNAALAALKAAGAEAEELSNTYYWSSSENLSFNSWNLNMGNGNRIYTNKSNNYSERVFQLVENCFNPSSLSAGVNGGGESASAPKIGDIMYDDKTWGTAADCDAAIKSGKTAVGVITEVNDDGSVKIVNLKDLTFSSQTAEDNFDADNPYGGAYSTTRWSTGSQMYKDIEGIENFADWELVLAMNPDISVVDADALNAAFADVDAAEYQNRYNEVHSQYDALIDDSSYNGVNLLKNGQLEVAFNETRSNKYSVIGKDMSTKGLGISAASWTKADDVAAAVKELQQAVAELRSFAGELGNNYSVIQTRQSFTEALSDVLETGADMLTLADMNEESANYLALQTRQQLAVNSLSLAAESSRSVLSLF